MEADSPPNHSTVEAHTDSVSASEKEPLNTTRLNNSCDETDADTTIHGFNITHNDTVIEKQNNSLEVEVNQPLKHVPCEGSDSGVEVIENIDPSVYQRALSSNSANSQDFDNINGARSCDSPLSCCSNYEEAYNLLVRRNSTLLEDYTLRNGDGTSENGSESSSIIGPSTRTTKRNILNSAKKKVSVTEAKTKSTLAKERSRSKPPITSRPTPSPRLKSLDRLQNKTPLSSSTAKQTNLKSKQTPTNLELPNTNRKEVRRSASIRTSSSTRSPAVTPTDDGRWPSVNSKPAPLMSRSLKLSLDSQPRLKISQMDSKTIEKYATLPRRKKEKSADSILKDQKKSRSRENSTNSIPSPKRQNPITPAKLTPSVYSIKKKQKTKIYHEVSIQTALTSLDIIKAFSGEPITPIDPKKIELCHQDVQVDMRLKDVEQLQEKLKALTEKYDTLNVDFKQQSQRLKETEEKLNEERLEKEGLKRELAINSQRVLAILGKDSNTLEEENASSDSLMVLETRYQNVGKVVIQQEEEISKLNNCCRTLQIDLEKSVAAQKTLLQQQQELEAESIELQEFMQAEKTTLTEALKECESEIKKCKQVIAQKEKELQDKQEECKHLVRLSIQRRQENLELQAKLGTLETKSRELLVHQGSSVSGAAVALSALIGRLDGLVDELVVAYNISDQELEDVIFHNEAYNNSTSSTESTPEKARAIFAEKTPSPKKGSSFVSAVINAIKNAAAQTPFAGNRDLSKDNLYTEHSSSNEMLDSETEPCLMMEHVLEDVVVPDGHSHNMISSGHSMLNSCLTRSESLKDLSQAIISRQISEQGNITYAGSLNASLTSEIASLTDIFPSISLVDQVIDVDNSITRLLKVIRILQLENDDCMNELQEQRDNLSEQIVKQKETNKVVVKQLKDWEVLGARLKTEVKELMTQLSKKNTEMDNIKAELNNQREQVEKLNQDVCELSTALAKAELETRIKEDEVSEAIKKWEKTGDVPEPDILGRLVVSQNEIPLIKEKLAEKEKHLAELTQEFLASRQVLTESLKDAVNEAKKQYEAIDNALEVLHSIQSVVQQCPPLSQLQRDLEEKNFQMASAMPIMAPSDCNANAALLQAVANLEIGTPINTTA